MPNPDLPPYRRAAPMITPDYSLNAAPRQVGRSMNDPERMQEIAMRRMRSQGDFAGAAKLATNQAWLDARLLGRNGATPMVSPDYSLDAAPRQVGRSMNDPERMQEIAMRRMRSQGDFAGAAKLAQNQAWLDAPGLPPLEFGGAFANGGIAPPGKVSLVGERGPELIMPSGPTAVVPMGQIPTRAAPLVNTGSAMDRHMSTGLSGQSPRPVGRSMNDPQRQQEIAMRRMRSQGDIQGAARLAQRQAWLDARFLGRNAPAMMPAGPATPTGAAPMPMPEMPGGKLVPGRSAGSMVWQPGATAEPMTPPEPPSVVAPPMAASAPAAPEPLQGLNPLTGLPLNMPAPKLPMGTIAANQNGFPGLLQPPDGLYSEPGRNGEPLPVTTVPIAGTNYVMPIADGKPMGTLPVQRPDPQPLPGMVPTAIESNGVRYETPGGKPVKPDISWQEDPKTGAKVPYQTMIDAKGNVTLRRVPIIDANNDGVDDRAQGGGAAAAPAAPRPTSGTLPSGIKFTLK